MPRKSLARGVKLVIAYNQATGLFGSRVGAPAKAAAVRKLHTSQGSSLGNHLTGRDQHTGYRQVGRTWASILPDSFAAAPYLRLGLARHLATASTPLSTPAACLQAPTFAARPLFAATAAAPAALPAAQPQRTLKTSSTRMRLASNPLWHYATMQGARPASSVATPSASASRLDRPGKQQALRWLSGLAAGQKKNLTTAHKQPRRTSKKGSPLARAIQAYARLDKA